MTVNGQITLPYQKNNNEGHERLVAKMKNMLNDMGMENRLIPTSLYFGKKIHRSQLFVMFYVLTRRIKFLPEGRPDASATQAAPPPYAGLRSRRSRKPSSWRRSR